MSHLFTLQISGIDPERDSDILYDAGCDDALIAVIDGAVYLGFDRDAPSWDQAVESAKRAVESAGGKVLGVMATPE